MARQVRKAPKAIPEPQDPPDRRENKGRREKTVQSVLLVYRDRRATRAIRDRKELSDRLDLREKPVLRDQRATRAIRDRKELSDRLDLREKPVLRDRRATRAIREQRHGKVSRTSRNLLLLRPESPRQALYMSVTKSGPLPEAVSGMSALPRNMGYSPAMTAVHSISW